MMKKKLLLKNIPNSKLECTNHTLFQTKIVTIDTLFQTKTAKKPYPLALHIPIYLAYLREYPPPPTGAKNALQIMSLAAYAGETKKKRGATYLIFACAKKCNKLKAGCFESTIVFEMELGFSQSSDLGPPTTMFCKISVRRSKYCLKFSITLEQLTIF